MAVKTTLLAFTGYVDMDRKEASHAADAPWSNRWISPARGAHSSKPVARSAAIDRLDRQTDGRAPDRYIAPAPYTMSVGNLAAGRVAIVELVVEPSNVVVVIIVVVVVVVV